MLFKQLVVPPIGTNCYLFGDEAAGVGAVVDPGGDAPAILSAARALGLQIKLILLTHGHFDHTGAVEELRRALPGVPVYLHSADKALLGGELMPPVADTLDYQDGGVLRLGGLDVHVLSTPGHTPGGVTLRVGDALFTGDTLFCGSMGRTDLPGGSYEALMASLKRLGELPGDYAVYPGHDRASTLEDERRQNYFLREAMRA